LCFCCVYLLHFGLRTFARCPCGCRSEAAGRVIGARSPIERVLPHFTSALLAFAWEATLVDPFVDPQAAVASTASAAASVAATTTFFILPSSEFSCTRLRRQSSSFVCLIRARGGIAGGREDGDDSHWGVSGVLE